MRSLFILVTFFSFSAMSLSQSCLPEGIAFTIQEQIDSFQINYPNCHGIEGYVNIAGDDINNLNGLNILTSIGGYLQIVDGDSLTSSTVGDCVTLVGTDADTWFVKSAYPSSTDWPDTN